MSSKKKIIDKEFKMNAVKYKKEHPKLTYDEVASNLGISTSSIHRWVKAYSSCEEKDDDLSNVFRESGHFSSDEVKELARLKKENRDLKDALEILEKAISIVSNRERLSIVSLRNILKKKLEFHKY